MSVITDRAIGSGVSDVSALIVGDARADAEERIYVYAYMYRARILEALESQFPRLAKLLGADAFADLAMAYITDEPSRHPSLRHVGQRLSGWLNANRADTPGLAGLAGLEWARADVFDMADDTTLTIDRVRAWPMERFGEIPLRLIAAQQLVTVRAGTARLWDAVGGDRLDGTANHPEVILQDGDDRGPRREAMHETIIVWREGTLVYHRVIDDAERAALELVSRGTSFGVVCESLVGRQGDEAAVSQAHSWMVTWLADRLLQESF